MHIYYIYAYLRKSDNTPYYIGKGKKARAFNKHTTVSTPSTTARIVIMESDLTELGAFALERRYIRWYGRKDNNTGILHNKTDGGDGVAGFKRSKESIAMQHSTRKVKGSASRALTDDARLRISKSLKGRSKPKHHVNQIAEKLRGQRWWTDGTINCKSLTCPGESWRAGRINHNPYTINPNRKPKVVTEETRRKLSEANKGHNKGIKRDPDVVARIAATNKGRLWWTDGVINKKNAVCPGPEWRSGKIHHRQTT